MRSILAHSHSEAGFTVAAMQSVVVCGSLQVTVTGASSRESEIASGMRGPGADSADAARCNKVKRSENSMSEGAGFGGSPETLKGMRFNNDQQQQQSSLLIILRAVIINDK